MTNMQKWVFKLWRARTGLNISLHSFNDENQMNQTYTDPKNI